MITKSSRCDWFL